MLIFTSSLSAYYAHFSILILNLTEMGTRFAILLVVAFFCSAQCVFVVNKLETESTKLRGSTDKCGYNACNPGKPGFLNVHLVPHTHDDVGWLKTVDQYYWNTKAEIFNAGVKYILDSVVENLEKNPDRKFIYVEIAYFWRWWHQQSDIMKLRVKSLVRNGQLQFTLGGWSMEDEASTHYVAIIDQMGLGMNFLKRVFGECGRPLASWQIDPFGHARQQASLFAQMGFDSLFFGRADDQDKAKREKEKSLELVWRASPNLGAPSNLFTGISAFHYSPPAGFNFENHDAGNFLFADDPTLDEYNVEKVVLKFVDQVHLWSAQYGTNHVMMYMGDDFTYQLGGYWFDNMDKLISHTNANSSRKVRMREKLHWLGVHCRCGEDSTLFTSICSGLYQPPPGLYFDIMNHQELISDDPTLDDYNVNEKVDQMFEAAKAWATTYATNHIMLYMGNDFAYQQAGYWFENMDKLIKHGNARQANGSKVSWDLSRTEEYTHLFQINVFYSTPACYALALNKLNRTWTTKDDDFFPLGNGPYTYWTGYFTSRPTLKRYVRIANNILQAGKQLDVIAQLGQLDNAYQKLGVLKRAMGVAQHHDAVSGTEKQVVADDYAKRLANGIDGTTQVINDAMRNLMFGTEKPPAVQFCPYSNISVCPVTMDQTHLAVVVYNSYSHQQTYWIRVPVDMGNFTVTDETGKIVPSQAIPTSAESNAIAELYGNHTSPLQICFQMTTQPLGFRTLFITKASKIPTMPHMSAPRTDFSISNNLLRAVFDGTTGLLKQLDNIPSKISTKINQTLLYYKSATTGPRVSGAYIFRPNKTDAFSINEKPKFTLIKGPLVQEVRVVFSDWASHVTRLYQRSNYLEYEWTVGPLPTIHEGKEVITRLHSDLATKSLFYTDSNGREMIQRKRNYRPTWPLKTNEPVSSNYYPVNTRMFIRDEAQLSRQLVILTDRSQGGTSIFDGSAELMVHRRTTKDDGLGVSEPLNETGPDHEGLRVRGTHWIVFDTQAKCPRIHRELAMQVFHQPIVGLTPTKLSPKEWISKFRTSNNGMKQLPSNVHLISLEQWDGPHEYLVRLEHFYEKLEDRGLSQPATVILKDLFSPLTIASVKEMGLAGNIALEDIHRLNWNIKSKGSSSHSRFAGRTVSHEGPLPYNDFTVVLKPMEIKTLIVTFGPK